MIVDARVGFGARMGMRSGPAMRVVVTVYDFKAIAIRPLRVDVLGRQNRQGEHGENAERDDAPPTGARPCHLKHYQCRFAACQTNRLSVPCADVGTNEQGRRGGPAQ